VSSSDRAIAEALFDQAVDAMKAKDYATACAKFAESQRLDPSAGTAFNLGRCYQVTERFASAWASFREAASIARRHRDHELHQLATQAADPLETQLPKLLIAVPTAHRVAALHVLRNGSAVNASLWGAELPVDAGSHEIEARAPGHHAWSTMVTVPNEPTVITVEVPALQKAPEPPQPQPSGPAAAPLAPAAAWAPPHHGASTLRVSADDGAVAGMSTMRTAGFVVGGVGVASLVAFGVTGALFLSEKDAAQDACPLEPGSDDLHVCSTPEGVAAADSARDLATANTVLFFSGVVATGSGLALILLGGNDASERAQIAPVFGPSRVGATLRGVF